MRAWRVLSTDTPGRSTCGASPAHRTHGPRTTIATSCTLNPTHMPTHPSSTGRCRFPSRAPRRRGLCASHPHPSAGRIQPPACSSGARGQARPSCSRRRGGGSRSRGRSRRPAAAGRAAGGAGGGTDAPAPPQRAHKRCRGCGGGSSGGVARQRAGAACRAAERERCAGWSGGHVPQVG